MEYILAIITLILIFISGFVAIWFFTGYCAKHSKFYGEDL